MPRIQLPLRWRIAWWSLLLLSAALGTHSLTKAAIVAGVLESSGKQIPVVLSAALAVALVVSWVVWANLTRNIVEAHGGTVAVVRNWAMSSATILILLSVVLPSDNEAVHLIRVAAAALLVVGAFLARARIQSWLTAPGPPAGAGVPRAETVLTPSLSGVPSPEPRPEDWDAGRWDPEIQADIERRRHRETR
ncbi:hypothetical protein Aau02nite_26550 [Amorphoplanes auranticolor]|uniref:Uncharacterized protein n=1 Tax=Actinoplanes auranticolor TaxID=47988 RepID=A0A919S9H6_9ACTN|nr:hypothetical protein Aau02nite_26550 [Actinoplanes auranticolor]